MRYTGLTGQVILPGNFLYPKARQVWNEAINKYPCIIVYCFDVCDIVNAVEWSKKHGVKLRIRSGGHNYEGYSIGNDVLVIDTSFMNNIRVNCEDNTVEVQAGTRLMKLYETLSRYGYTFPGGTCPTVAISGLVLGGGIGLSARYLGLTADSLAAAEMIDARGNGLIADNCHNESLFWALRGGGGGNFGVVTSYKFNLCKVDKITLIQLEWHNNKPARLEFLQVWQEWLRGLDCRATAFGGIYKQGAWVNSFFYGRPEEAEQVFEPLLNIPGITFKNIEYVEFIEAVRQIASGYPDREAFKSTGRFVQRCFSQAELANLITIIDNAPTDASSYISVYSLGGAIKEVDDDETAFFYRRADYIMGISSTWKTKEEAPAHKQWVEKGFRYIYTLTVGSFVNFPYNELPDYQEAYYGENVRKLECVKKKYDPHNVFTFPQSIKRSNLR